MENILYKRQSDSTSYFERNGQDFITFCKELKEMTECIPFERELVFLCIGTDRMTGDCLGPLVGHKLKKYCSCSSHIFGTLKQPVHAQNLQYVLTQIRLRISDPFFIVIDASVGLPGSIGCITLSREPLFPGQGMKKALPPVGDLSITGIVNSCHGNTTALLQNTRLHLVNEMADFIFSGLIHCFPL